MAKKLLGGVQMLYFFLATCNRCKKLCFLPQKYTDRGEHDVVHERCWEQEEQYSKCKGSHKQLVRWVLAWINTFSQGIVFLSQKQSPQCYQPWHLQTVQP